MSAPERKLRVREVDGELMFFRFTVNQRFQHAIFALCVIVLVITGMPLKFHEHRWAVVLYDLVGGIDVAPLIHRGAGVVLLSVFVFHVVYVLSIIYRNDIKPLRGTGKLGLKELVRIVLRQPLMPRPRDLKDIFAGIKYLLYLSPERPRGAWFTWKEKADYWAPFWGIAVIGASGAMMWNMEASTQLVPGWALNFALIAHSEEAVLAALFLAVWHWYNVHFSRAVFPMNPVFLTGWLPEHLMIEEHYETYLEMMAEAGFEDRIKPMPSADTEEGSR